MEILILGSTGMLGSTVKSYFKEHNIDADTPSRKELDKVNYSNYDYIINCIGIIKHKLTDPKEAIEINSLFPYMLAEKAPQAKIIQIATDCVYSGKKGNYIETDEHDALDIYGKTKSLGEVQKDNFYNIRTSIVGPNGKYGLLDWFLSQKYNADIDGYINHYWNGITTLHFAKLCSFLIKENIQIPNNLHFIPRNIVSKYELLGIFAERFKREDIKIFPVKTPMIDRSLNTIHTDIVKSLWNSMGYEITPTVEEMVYEL